MVRLQVLLGKEDKICPGSQGRGLSVEAQIENAAAAEDVSALPPIAPLGM